MPRKIIFWPNWSTKALPSTWKRRGKPPGPTVGEGVIVGNGVIVGVTVGGPGVGAVVGGIGVACWQAAKRSAITNGVGHVVIFIFHLIKTNLAIT